MPYNFFPLRRYLLLCVLTLLLAACGGGGGGGSTAANNAGGAQPTPTPVQEAAPAGDAIASVPDSALVTPDNNSAEVNCPTASAFSLSAPPAPANGKIKGRISFERVPFFATPGQGLNYANPQVLPARGVVVEALAPTDGACSGPALATTLTDGDGWYELAVAADTPVCIRARAQLYRAADDNGSSWNFAVADNTADNRLYALIESGAASPAMRARRDLHAASGWSSGDYRAPRAAAPFAALDTLCKTLDAVLAAKAPAQFGQLTVFWSDRNGDDKNLTLAQGNIGGTHFDPGTMAIYLRGDADVNADEFDEVVIAHEFGHFATQRFSRSDTIGGRHYLTDKVDPRLAFDEGWATAFAGLVLGTSTYRDSLGPGSDFNFDIATPNPAYPHGWYAESALQSALFSIGGGAGVGLSGLLQTFAGHYKDTPALASIFSYAYHLKNDQPAFANGIANLLDAQQIGGANIQPFADAETNAPSPTDLPIYQTLGVLGQGGVARVVCSDNIYDYREVHRNALSLRRYLKFSAPFAGNFRFSIEPQSSDGVAGFELLARGAQLAYRQASAANSTLNIVRTLAAGDYVVGVFDGDFLSATVDVSVPRATQCFNVSVQAI